ncbi:MAG: heat-shock protein HtpX [Fimbriimonadaceae bacterium]|nr:heat-shock protein HtpX [Fimbriimonadaceae bacterium]
MAEAILNRMASNYGLPFKAASAGTVGGKTINPVALQVMDEIGISMADQSPKLLTQAMVDEADLIVTMGCGVDAEACPAKFLISEDWGLDDPAGQPVEVVRRIRDEIQARVAGLLGME